MKLWEMYGLDNLAVSGGFRDGDRPDHSFGLLVYSLVYGHKAHRVVVAGYGNGYIPALATAGQVATGLRGKVVSVDASPCDGGEYVRHHGFGDSHEFLHGDLAGAALHAISRLGGLIDVLVIVSQRGAWEAYSELLADDGVCVVFGGLGSEAVAGYSAISLRPSVVLARRDKR